jgi:hypothetical protein
LTFKDIGFVLDLNQRGVERQYTAFMAQQPPFCSINEVARFILQYLRSEDAL